VCIEARVDTNTVEQGRMTKDDLARMTQAAQWMSTLPIIIDDERCTPQELRERVLAHKEMFASGKARNHNGHLFPKCRLQLVMVDYLQKGKWPTTLPNNAPRHERVAAISNGLVEEVAKGCDVATLVLAQVNRAVEGKNVKDRRPTLADLKESGDIEQDADTVLFVHRESFYLRNQTPLEHRNVAEVIVTKGRYGMPDDPVALLGFYRGFFSNEVPRPALEAREERQREQEKEREKAS
jgi:replicative DNA helicase